MDDEPLGWNVYSNGGGDRYSFIKFIPAPGLDEKLETMTDRLVTEIEEAGQ